MAQVSSATEPVAANYQPGLPGQNGILTAADLDEIREYQKVIQFRDTIVSGKHPRIKVSKPITVNPQQSDSLATERVAPSSTSTSSHALQYAPNLNTLQMDNMQSFKANSQQPAVVVTTTGSTGPTLAAPSFSRPVGSGKTDANHVSHDSPQSSYKAQLQRRRQILEEEIKDQNGKASPKNPQHSDHILGYDLSDILAKALTLVQATFPQPPLNSSNGTNASDSGDSFDNNTFYTSSLNTPDTRPSPRVQNTASQDIQVQDATASLHQRPAPAYTPQQNNSLQPRPVPTLSYQTDLSRSAQPIQVTSSSQQAQLNIGNLPAPIHDHTVYPSKASREGDLMTQSRQIREAEAQVISSDSAAPSRSDNSGNTDSDQPADYSRFQAQHHLLPSAQFRQRGSPLVRAHDLSPLAPQPAHVSPLATARHPPMPDPEVSILPGAPAQVTALRQERTVIISPESSPQGDKGGKKKNKKNKNKRKAETRAPDIPGSPEIKPEPRSPSPLTAPQFTRPQKRLRSATRPEQELAYDEPRIDRPVSVLHREQYPAAHVQAERPSYGLEVIDDPYTQVRQSVAPASQRLDRAIYEERRPDGAAIQYVRRVQSPYSYTAPYGAVETRPLRAASYSVNPQYREVPTYQRDGRMSARPYVDRARSRSPVVIERRSPVMAPPAPPPARIIVDQYGREYIDPPRPSTVARQSVVPAPRPSEREIVYERVPVPMRAPSRLPAETFEEDGIVYRRASPTYAPRRVITQPEYGVDYRSYRERDYSVQPLGPPAPDYAPIRGATERRVAEDVARDYLPRATSVRPAEAVPYYGRLDTVRPEAPPRQYAASVHPEVRTAPAIREFSVRPAERDVPRREFSVRPVERYYDRPHADEEVTYIERPRAAQQEIIYADNSRRQVYQ
ncbi:suppressor of deletion of TFIIS [Hypoxylon texense]